MEDTAVEFWLGRLSPTWQPVEDLSEIDSRSLEHVVSLGLAEYRYQTCFLKPGDPRKVTVVADVSGDCWNQFAIEMADILVATAPWEVVNVVANKTLLSVRLTAAGTAMGTCETGVAMIGGRIEIVSIDLSPEIVPSQSPSGREQSANSANILAIFPHHAPRNKKLIELAVRIQSEGGSRKAIAREICNGNRDMAESLCTALRTMIRKGLCTLSRGDSANT